MTIQSINIPLRFLKALAQFVRQPKLLRLALVPYLIGIIAFILGIGLSFSYLEPISSSIYQFENWWLQNLMEWVITPLLLIAISAITALLLMTTLGSFFLESIIVHVFRESGIELPKDPSFLSLPTSLIRGLLDDCVRLLYIIPILLLTFVVGLLPPFYIFPLLLSAFMIGFDLNDICLTLLGKNFKERAQHIAAHKMETLALGGTMSILLLIPFGGVLFLPVAYYVTAETICTWDLKP